MTFNEILKKISKYQRDEMAAIALGKDVNNLLNALLFVVLLHKPQEITLPDGSYGQNCYHCDGFDYPCVTIQAIEKELG